jgi:hypothetical protein
MILSVNSRICFPQISHMNCEMFLFIYYHDFVADFCFVSRSYSDKILDQFLYLRVVILGYCVWNLYFPQQIIRTNKYLI